MSKLIKFAAPVGEIVSARGLFTRGIVLVGVFVVCHLAGLRRFAGFLCGTLEAAPGMREVSALLGFVYVIMYLACTVVSPILLIAAGLLFAWQRVKGAS